MSTIGKVNLVDLAASIVRCFPSLDLIQQRLSLELYRLLAARLKNEAQYREVL